MSKLTDCTRKAKNLPLEIKQALHQNTQNLINNSDLSEVDAAKTVVQQFLDVTQRDIKTINDALKKAAEPTPEPEFPQFATGTPTPTPAKVEIPKDVASGWNPTRIFASIPDILAKNPRTEWIARNVMAMHDEQQKLRGQLGHEWRKVLRNISPGAFRELKKGQLPTPFVRSKKEKKDHKDFEDYGEARGYDRDDAKAKQIYNQASPEAKEAIDLADKQYDWTIKDAQNRGFKVQNGFGKWVPIGKVKLFRPRRIKPKVQEMLRNPKNHDTEVQEFSQELLKDGLIGDISEAWAYIQDLGSQQLVDQGGMRRFNAIEKSYNSKMIYPRSAYDWSVKSTLDYMQDYAKRAPEQTHLGQKAGPGTMDILQKAHKEAASDKERALISRLSDLIYNNFDSEGIVAEARSILNNATTATQLIQDISTLNNLFGGVVSAVHKFGGGVKMIARVPKAAYEAAFRSRDELYENGILNEDLANMASDTMFGEKGVVAGFTQQVTQKGLTWSGFQPIEKYVRTFQFIMQKAWLRDAIWEHNNRPGSNKDLWNHRYLKKLYLDPTEVLLENGKGPATDSFFRQGVNRSQGSYDWASSPYLLNTPNGKSWLKYFKARTQASRWFVNDVLNPALEYLGKGKDTVRVRDPHTGTMSEKKVPASIQPLIKYLTLFLLAGAAKEELFELLGRDPRSSRWEEILNAWYNKDPEAFSLTVQKLWNYTLLSEAFGILGSGADTAYRAYEHISSRKDLKDVPEIFFDPAVLALPKGLWELGTKLLQQGYLSPHDVDQAALRNVGAWRMGRRWVSLANDAFGGEHRASLAFGREADRKLTRQEVKRFANTLNMKEKVYQDFPSTPMTPVKQAVREAVGLGDDKEVNRLIKENTKDMTPKEKKKYMDDMKRSVSDGQPIKVAGYRNADTRKEFIKWAKTHISKDKLDRILEYDATYRKTAQRANLLYKDSDREASFEEQVAKHQK